MNDRPTDPAWPTQSVSAPPGPPGWGQPTPPMGAPTGAQNARPVAPMPPYGGPGMPPYGGPGMPPTSGPGMPPPGHQPLQAGGPPPVARPAPATTRPPREPWPSEGAGHRRRADRGPGAGSLVVGGIFILAGVWFLIREFAPELEPSRFWPVAIVALGLVLLLASLAGRARSRGGDRP